MAKPTPLKKAAPPPAPKGITKITVAGFKSINEEQSVEIRPLTVLAGANSSGKSSIMQPILLLKQTLEASYDPGPLRLDGPNVRFTSADQFLSYVGRGKHTDGFYVGVGLGGGTSVTTHFQRQPGRALEVQKMMGVEHGEKTMLRAGMTDNEILSEAIPARREKLVRDLSKACKFAVTRDRCFLEVDFYLEENLIIYTETLGSEIAPHIREVIHVPGLRGNPERTYLVAAVGSTFPGTFENYVASAIAKWQAEADEGNLERLGQDLKELGLTWKVSATPLNDTQVELQVGRLSEGAKGGSRDMVSIADVGFGVSQTLPVLVALRIAKPGQLVYLEQPEIHLHPRAQTSMAKVLADAASRGVHVVAETHSALLILGIQTLVAEGKLSPDLVKLHWFERKAGGTKVRSADLDEAGSFGDWPEDFADIALEAQSKYLDAVEARVMGKKKRAS